MIWHLLEVWLLVVLMFVIGCLAGAWLYRFAADSRLAIVQGVVADSVGDVLDRVKARVGLAPAWRPVHLRNIERPMPSPVARGGGESPVRERQGKPDSDRRATPESRRRGAAHPLKSEARRAAGSAAARAVIDEGDPDDAEAASALATAGESDDPAAQRPAGLGAPRGGVPDNLQRIKGIGKRNEALLNSLGIYHFGQIAAWTPGEVRWIGGYLKFPERIGRDDWVGQAMVLAIGDGTGFEKSAERRRRRRHQEREFRSRMESATEQPGAADGGPALDETEDEEPGVDRETRPADEPLADDEPLDAEFEEIEPPPEGKR